MPNLPTVEALAHEIEVVAGDTGFAGVVRVDLPAGTVERAFGIADRRHGTPVSTGTTFGTASVTKGFTALAVMRLVDDGVLRLATTARSFLGDDLPLVADDVTIEHLLAHRSGVGDHVDEEAIDDIATFFLDVPVGRLTTPTAHLPLLEGLPPRFPAGERFSYCNGGYVVLALLAERASGRAFPDLVTDLVFRPAGMTTTAFLRSDELPPDAATGYLSADGLRSNVHHLPVVGSGDGGCYTTTGDLHRLWEALGAGAVVAPDTYTEMTRPRSEDGEGHAYGLGFWLAPDGGVRWLEGCDAGVSAVTCRDPRRGTTWTVLSNTTDGAWPVARHLRDTVGH